MPEPAAGARDRDAARAATPPRLLAYPSPARLAEAVAAAVREALESALRERGAASLVVPGGPTPRAYFPRLAALELPWERVVVTLSDERRVPGGDARSNERLVRERLLQGRAAAARFVPLQASGDADPVAGANARLASVPRPFDLVLLGLGADGHVASLFPGAAGLATALDPARREDCVAIEPPRGIEPAVGRVSLTLAALLASRRILIAAQGEDKRTAWERALRGEGPRPAPVPALAAHAAAPIDFLWCPG